MCFLLSKHWYRTVEDIIGEGRGVAIWEELSVDLLELGFGELPGWTILEEALVPGLKFSFIEFRGFLQLFKLLRAQLALS
jgi:hypothetical protein